MRLSENYFVTFKEKTSSDDSVSASLLLKAGMIKKAGSGIYVFLPLGLRVIKKIENIIREEMNSINSLELQMPSLLPEEVYIKSGRRDVFGKDMFSLNDRFDRRYVLGPTHEEMFVSVVSDYIKSYKNFPISLYQIATKFRDEPRSRYGLIRTREFIMKDAYTFDKDLEGLDKSYNLMFNAYKNIFNKIGIDYKIVKASTGVMGGLLSEEFQAVCDIGEDTLAICDNCGYSSNIELCSTNKKCPDCQQDLSFKKGIEIGNTFKLGTKYSESLGLQYLDENNILKYPFMGCYGIGVARILAAVVEQNHDENGIIFPKSISPFDVHLIVVNNKDQNQCRTANEVYDILTSKGLEVLYDDRDERVGVRFHDADLIGIPKQIIIGNNASINKVEVKNRKFNTIDTIDIDKLISCI